MGYARTGPGEIGRGVGRMPEDEEVAVSEPAQQIAGLDTRLAVEFARIVSETVGQLADECVHRRGVRGGKMNVVEHSA